MVIHPSGSNSPTSQDQSLQFSKVQALCLLLSMELARSVNPDIVSYSSVISAAEKGAFLEVGENEKG